MIIFLHTLMHHTAQKIYPLLQTEIVPRVKKLFMNTSQSTLLHVGDIWFNEVSQHKRITQYSISDRQTVRSPISSISSVVGSVVALPFQQSSMDMITTSYLKEYEKDCECAIQELWRVLKPNGYLCIVGNEDFYNPYKIPETIPKALNRLMSAYRIQIALKKMHALIEINRYYFDKMIPNTSFYQCMKYYLAACIPKEKHYYFIVAKKQLNNTNTLPMKEAILSFPIIRKNIYAERSNFYRRCLSR